MNPLNSVRGAITTGVILALAVTFLIQPTQFHELGLARWLHIMSGVMWIGLLYYFNVAQIPGLAAAAADKGGPGGAGITRYVAPRALFWFRWAALATWLTGAWYLGRGANFGNAFTLGHFGQDYYGLIIGIGAWLGTIMLFNVWVLIWPNQKKVLGIVPASDEEKAKARKIATLASRTNFVLSIPMLLCMGSASHGLPF
ncbi:MAG: urate hydroxylase PuuD [Steroidobacteraceae bacterium]